MQKLQTLNPFENSLLFKDPDEDIGILSEF